jgi:hypothetical protein
MRNMMLTFAVCAVLLGAPGSGSTYAVDKWPGVDDAVVKRIAREHGREVRPSLIPAAEGDLQLFVFLLAGTVGGFVAGYCWRGLLEGKKKQGDGGESVQG